MATTKIANAIISEIASYVDICVTSLIERVFPPFSRMVQLYPVTTYLDYFTIFMYFCNDILINIKRDSSPAVQNDMCHPERSEGSVFVLE